MRVTVDALAPMRDRQGLLVAELHAGRDDPAGAPVVAMPVRVSGVTARRDDTFVGLHDPNAPSPGPVSRFAFARVRPVRRDGESVGVLHHLLQWAVAGAGERSRRAAAKLSRFAELKIGTIGRAAPVQRPGRDGYGR